MRTTKGRQLGTGLKTCGRSPSFELARSSDGPPGAGGLLFSVRDQCPALNTRTGGHMYIGIGTAILVVILLIIIF